nr:uncharacterized protein LOC112211123 [Halyomorpha halys]
MALFLVQGIAAGGWFDGPPSPLYPSSGKRHHLPYHPVARFRGADTRPYYPYEVNLFPEYIPPPSVSQVGQGAVPEGPMNAGELLALLFSGIRQGEQSSRMRGTLRFGIARR